MSVQENLGLGDEMVPWTDVDVRAPTLAILTVLTFILSLLTSLFGQEQAGILTVNAPVSQFYNHMPTKETEKWAAQVVPQAIKSFQQKATYAATSDPAYNGKCGYLICEDDQSFVLPLQKLWVESSGITLTKTLPTSHSPFLDMPRETVDAVVSFISDFEDK